jgi:preprotein translocase subunit SecD
MSRRGGRRGLGELLVLSGAALGAVLLLGGCSVVSTTTTAPTVAPDPLTSQSPAPVLDLQLRQVLGVQTPGVADCTTKPPPQPDPALPARLCSEDRTSLYSLAPAAVTGARITGMETSLQGGAPVIQVRLDARGASQLSRITAAVMGERVPRSQLAIVAHGRVQSAPVIGEQIDTGVMILSGFASEQAAQGAIDFLIARPVATATPTASGPVSSTSSSSPSG